MGSANNPDHPYSIGEISPCCDAGYDDANSETYDLRGADFPRKLDKTTGDEGTIDIGAYEYKVGVDPSLPVTLSVFTAQYINDTPTLCWTTHSETNNAGWNIYRGETSDALSNEETFQLNLSLGLIPGAGTTSEPTDYNFEDVFPVFQETTYFYWLESVDYSGESEIYGPISLTIPEDEWENPNSPEIPKNYGLHQNYPNPFNPNTEISFMMKENCIAELSVYNIKGEKISTLFQNKSVAKDELIRANWDGKDDFGKAVSSGIYLYKLRTNKEEYSRKMILMK
ncbi:MAG: T9SS type A sorting domain-containing protein [Armatimonadetes bacterium]|nr:T9SS type A sorting domain-containing protein [Armatimonadota bacterium]